MKTIDEFSIKEFRGLMCLLLDLRCFDSCVDTKVLNKDDNEIVLAYLSDETNYIVSVPDTRIIPDSDREYGVTDLVKKARYYNAIVTAKYGLHYESNFSWLKYGETYFFIDGKFEGFDRSEIDVSKDEDSLFYDKVDTSFISISNELNGTTNDWNIRRLAVDILYNRESRPDANWIKDNVSEFHIEVLYDLLSSLGMKNYIKDVLDIYRQEGYEEGLLLGQISLLKNEFGYTVEEVIKEFKDHSKYRIIEIYYKD